MCALLWADTQVRPYEGRKYITCMSATWYKIIPQAPAVLIHQFLGEFFDFLPPPDGEDIPQRRKQDFFCFLAQISGSMALLVKGLFHLPAQFDDGFLLEGVEVPLHFGDHAFNPAIQQQQRQFAFLMTSTGENPGRSFFLPKEPEPLFSPQQSNFYAIISEYFSSGWLGA